MKKRFEKVISWNTIKFLLAIGLVIFVIKKTDISYMFSLNERISWAWVAARAVLFSLLIFIKAFQYYVLIGNTRYRDILTVVIWQNVISNFISNSVGITSYMTMLKTEQNVKLTRSGATFVIVKFGDLLAICLYLGFSAAMVWARIQSLKWLTILLIIGMIFGLGIFLITILWREGFVNLVTHILAWLKLERISLVQRGLEMLRSLAQEEQVKIFAMLRTSGLVSLIYMTVTMIEGYTIVGAFNLPISIWESVYIIALMQLVSFVPIQVLGGLGISEVTLVYLYGLFGINQAEASVVALGVRALFYLMNVVILLYLPINALFQRGKLSTTIRKGHGDN